MLSSAIETQQFQLKFSTGVPVLSPCFSHQYLQSAICKMIARGGVGLGLDWG